ncbi:MAG: SDR family NAD(P)-dependent oxidoreductase [Roseovarius sp.]|nr:SDR family NAD(P)-dependent oxidoreductase [Roseovarius sp.]
MDTALIIGASGGIGTALCDTLSARGVALTPLSRRVDGIDLTDEDSIKAALDPLEGPYDLIFVATGGLEIDGQRPEKSLKELNPQALSDQFALNCIGPALVLKHAPRLLARERRAVFAALSARVGSIGDNRFGGWYGYRAAKAALNQIVHTGAIELSRSHRQSICVSLHPGTVETPLTARYARNHPTVPAPEAAANLLSVIDGLTPSQTGQFFDWAGKPVPW